MGIGLAGSRSEGGPRRPRGLVQSALASLGGFARGDIVLATQRISKSFAGVPALRNVDFDLKCGEVHALMGENGAGKSTLMKILAGVHADYEGAVCVAGSPALFSFVGHSH